MFCIKCGEKLSENDKFCFNCGEKVNLSNAQVTENSEPVHIDNSLPINTPQTPKKQSSNKGIIIALVLALIATLLTGGYFYFIKPMKDNKDTASVKEETESKEELPQEETSTPIPEIAEPEIDIKTAQYDDLSSYISLFKDNGDLSLITNDVTEYPTVKLYYSYTDNDTVPIILEEPTARIKETIDSGKEIEREIKKIYRLEENQGVGIEILADKSGSMDSNLSMMQEIISQFIKDLDYNAGDQAEIISFDSFVMYMCSYTNDVSKLLNGIGNMSTYGETALYDALYQGVSNASLRPGANCVIAFTDGMDNRSIHTLSEVSNLATSKNIPVYIVSFGSGGYDELEYFAHDTNGYYWHIDNLTSLSEIFEKIYTVQKNMYCVEYVSDEKADAYKTRSVSLLLTDKERGQISEGISFTPNKKNENTSHTSRYEVIKKDITWVEAQEECIQKGGHLATITSQEEMDKLSKMADDAGIKYVWIGGYTSVRENSAYGHWLTGEPFDYTAWFNNEPSRNDKDGTPEFYLMLWKIKDVWSWNDQRNDIFDIENISYFNGATGYICEYEDAN